MIHTMLDQVRDNTSRNSPRQPSVVTVVASGVAIWAVILGAVWLVAMLSHYAPR